MSSIQVVFETGPLTFKVSASVKGGDWVGADASPAETVSPYTPAATPPLGVALYDAEPEGTSGAGTTSFGYTSYDFSVPQPHVATAYHGVVRLTAENTVNFGQAVEVASTGSGVAASLGTNAVVGYCVEPGGIAAGERGKIRLAL